MNMNKIRCASIRNASIRWRDWMLDWASAAAVCLLGFFDASIK
jgi:hypothetical protein